ncbi:MAG: hypothetical protein RLZZ383_1222 [Pseudomonadota bacterium]|jgi:hypothetical protein
MTPRFDRLPERARIAASLARKAFHQWLDTPSGVSPTPIFVLGCQRSGTTMLIDTLMRAPGLWSHPEKSPIAYDNFRLRSAPIVRAITARTPAQRVIYKPLCDSQLGDQLLEEHPDARVFWVVRRWQDVANSAVVKWGDHQRDVLQAILEGRADTVGWRGERIPSSLVDQLRDVVDTPLTAHAGAVLFWYLRNSFLFTLGLDRDPRVRLVVYEDLVQQPHDVFPRLFAHVGVPFSPSILADIHAKSVGRAQAPEVPPRIAALADALSERLRALAG